VVCTAESHRAGRTSGNLSRCALTAEFDPERFRQLVLEEADAESGLVPGGAVSSTPA
jgi:hypothetical protein